jgi:hypothetical protein
VRSGDRLVAAPLPLIPRDRVPVVEAPPHGADETAEVV